MIIDGEVLYRHGYWGPADRKKSSNTKEYRKLVNDVEDALKRGLLGGCEVFMFTYNMVTEGAYYKGNSLSQEMYECTLSLKELEMEGGFLLHVIHCTGTRMIAQGTDGLSRGVMWEGVMGGTPMSAYIPLHESPLQRDPSL